MRHPRAERSRYFSARQVREILARDNFTCVYCGHRAELIDHILSYAEGGRTNRENGVACCKSCNKLKENDSTKKYLVLGMAYIAKVMSGK